MALNERTRFLSGDAAGDGKGDMLRNHSLKAEATATQIYSWLSGGKSEVRLPDALPVERGGTGGTTAQKGRLNLGIVVNTNNELVFGSRVVSLYNGTFLDHEGTVKPIFTKVGIGHYTLTNITGFALNGFKYCLPKDELGNLLCGCAITFADGTATIKVYGLTRTDGLVSLDLTKPMDIPAQRCIDISTK